jgi:hypothetical protein
MRALACAAAVIACAPAASGCASSYAAHQHSSTDAIGLHELGYDQLSQPLREFVRSTVAQGSVTEIDVYGPASRTDLVRASSGDVVFQSPRQQRKPFYLIVLHGHFVCGGCHGPMGAKAPEGTIETYVWSHGASALDFGLSNNLPAAIYLLNRPAVIQPA